MKVDIMIFRKNYKNKPTGIEAAYMQSRFHLESLELEEIAGLLVKGNTIKPAEMGSTKNDGWVSQQLFAIDFDSGVTIEDVLERCRALEIEPCFAHTSFSHSEEVNKFRVYFATAIKIKDVRLRNLVQVTLVKSFSYSDQKVKDPTRMFFGGKSDIPGHGLIFKNLEGRLEPYNLINSHLGEIRTKGKNPKREFKSHCEEMGINLVEGLPNIVRIEESLEAESVDTEGFEGKTLKSGGKRHDLSLYFNSLCHVPTKIEDIPQDVDVGPITEYIVTYFGDVPFALEFSIKEKETKDLSKEKKVKYSVKNGKREKEDTELIRGFDFEELEKRCPLYEGFISGEYWAYHEEIFHLATNLGRVKGGQKRIIEALNHSNYDNTRTNKLNTVYFACNQGYEPSRCEGNCRLKSECLNTSKNILTGMKLKERSIRRIEKCEVNPLSYGEEAMESIYREVMAAKSNDVYTIKVDTGLGKTRMFTEETDLTGCCIAVCDHNLLNEVVERSKVVEKLHMGELQGLPESVREEYEYYLSIGDSKACTSVLITYLKELDYKRENIKNEDDNGEAEKLSNMAASIEAYINNRRNLNTTELPIFCTHQRAFTFSNPNIHTYIFDEDFIKSGLTSTIVFSEADIVGLITIAEGAEAFSVSTSLEKIRYLMGEAEKYQGVTQTVRSVSLKSSEVENLYKYMKANGIKVRVNLRNILRMDNFIFDGKFFHGIIKNNLPKGKIIVLSATIDHDIYRELISDRKVYLYQVGAVLTKGVIIHHYMGASRTYLKSNKGISNIVNKIKTESPNISNIISFKKEISKFRDEGFTPIAHLGACSGLDSYKGQDLIVVGTYHTNEVYYKLLATLINRKPIGNVKIKYKRIERNNFEFFMSTYEDGSLIQKIQMHLIESEMIQAAGRARVLREDCEVHIYGAMPINGSVLYEEVEGRPIKDVYLKNIKIINNEEGEIL